MTDPDTFDDISDAAIGGLRATVLAWVAADPDETAQAELEELLTSLDAGDSGALVELTDRFAGTLSFGTAGLRGPLRAGPNGMNTAVVRRTAAGLAAYLRDTQDPGGTVVIGYDGRHGSRSFAADSAAVFRAAGLVPLLLPRELPTPVLAFAVRRLGAVAGVMVTASHNPREDNGYKVYGSDGAQIISPTDALIEAAIGQVGAAVDVILDRDVTVLDESIVDEYTAAVAGLVADTPSRELTIVHTAMHGVGASVVRKAFAEAGFSAPVEVAEQAEPDPDFPTVAFPNPEEPGAMDRALALAAARDADLILANDPDADRCAVGVLDGGDWRMLTGNEVGVLLADWLMEHGRRGTYATTIVSSTMLAEMAADRGVAFVETLTGFKWISRAADDLAYGYEEALGYAVAPELVKDKDGISAGLTVAAMAASYRAAGSSLVARLASLGDRYGHHATEGLSWRVADPAEITAAMQALRAALPTELLGAEVTVRDLAPENDILIFGFDGGRVVVRPSGTEPKCKAYLEVVDRSNTPGRATELMTRLVEQVRAFVPL